MAKISAFLYSENAQKNVQNNIEPHSEKTIVINPLQVFYLAYIPSAFSFSITIGIQDFDVTVSHELSVLFKNPDESILTSATLSDTSIISNTQGEFTDFPYILISLDLRNIVFEVKGIYTTDVFFDKECLGSYPVYVAVE